MNGVLFIIGASMFIGGAAANNSRVPSEGFPVDILAALNVALLLNKCISYIGLCIAVLTTVFQAFTLILGA